MNGVAGVLAVLLIMLSPAAAIIDCDHNIPEKVSVGKSFTFELKFTDGLAPLDPQTVEVELTNPFNLDVTPALEEVGSGVYRFTYRFDVEGAYYLTVRAKKYGYISYSQSFMIDCVKKHVYIGWLTAFLNSPVIAVFIGAGGVALALHLKRRKRR